MIVTRAYELSDGDEVVTDANPGALYIVVAVHEAKAWVRELHGESEMIIDQDRCAPARFH